MSRISYTACNIASCLIALHSDTRWSFMVGKEDADFYSNCLAHTQKYSLFIRIFRPFPRLSKAIIELFFAKGMAVHLALRKIALRKLIEGAYASGATQCVVLGGGFDAGAYHMAVRHSDCTVYEIDRPFMHSLKMDTLRDSYGELAANFIGIPADLATVRLEHVLSAAYGFDRRKKTVFVAEGVIMYLSEANIVDLLQQMRSMTPSGSQFVFTATTHAHKVRRGFRRWVGNLFLSVYGETAGFEIESKNISDFLGGHDFKLSTLIENADLRSVVPVNNRPMPSYGQSGEYVVSAVAL